VAVDSQSRATAGGDAAALRARSAQPGRHAYRTHFSAGRGALTLAPHSQATILLDQGVLTTGYPVLVTSGGRGSLVRATYSEALYGDKRSKGDRRQIEGKQAIGVWDEWLPDGGRKRVFRPLWVRSWRYLELHIENRR
jgi:alpha-L-rhamnosidase